MSQASEAPTIDDEDEFLYGSSNTEPGTGAIPSTQSELPTVESTVDAKDSNDEDQYDSDDSDVEFIIDPNAPLVAPPPRVSTTFAPATISTPPPKPAQTVAEGAAQTSTSAPPAATNIAEDVPYQPPPQPAQSQAVDEASLGPEGPPPAAPSTGPHLNLDPSASDLYYPPSDGLYDARTEAQKAQDLPPMTIYQVDIDSLPEKPWRRPGANLSDWFNYGFDERSWSLWCGKRHEMEQMREDLQPLNASESAGAPVLPPGFSGGMPDFSALLGGGMLPPVPPPMQAWMNGMMPGGADAPSPVPIPVQPPMTSMTTTKRRMNPKCRLKNLQRRLLDKNRVGDTVNDLARTANDSKTNRCDTRIAIWCMVWATPWIMVCTPEIHDVMGVMKRRQGKNTMLIMAVITVPVVVNVLDKSADLAVEAKSVVLRMDPMRTMSVNMYPNALIMGGLVVRPR